MNNYQHRIKDEEKILHVIHEKKKMIFIIQPDRQTSCIL